jgi:hypothetical protein
LRLLFGFGAAGYFLGAIGMGSAVSVERDSPAQP